MDKSSPVVTPGLTPFLGYSLMIGMGVIFLVLANLIKNLWFEIPMTSSSPTDESALALGLELSSPSGLGPWPS
jgi:hypothetical protein